MNQIPTVTKNLLIINGIMFIATFVFERMGISLTDMLGLHFFVASDFHIYQLFTYMFMHANIAHIFFNMFALWMFGMVIERTWGPQKFLFYYITCGIGAGLTQEVSQLIYFCSATGISSIDMFNQVAAAYSTGLNGWTTIGASGAVYAILMAFGMIYPEERLFIFPLPIPIKAKWFVLFYIVIELLSAMGSSGDNVAHFAHLGGMLFGFLIIRYWRKHPNSYEDTMWGESNGSQFFENLKKNWEKRKKKSADNIFGGNGNKDWEYNANMKKQQEEIDRILDKIRRSGYDSLTDEEKKKLFDNSNKK